MGIKYVLLKSQAAGESSCIQYGIKCICSGMIRIYEDISEDKNVVKGMISSLIEGAVHPNQLDDAVYKLVAQNRRVVVSQAI